MIKDISNQKFNELTTIKYTGNKTKSGNAIWECKCSCGNTILVSQGQLQSGRTKSCGCLYDRNRETKKKHWQEVNKYVPQLP